MTIGNPRTKRFVILLADDDPGDQELTRRVLESDALCVELRIVSHGEEALDYLQQRGAYSHPADAPRPDLILLDLNMPRMGGKEVLRTLKQSSEFRRITVVILTTSEQEADIVATYDLGCNSYVQKPLEIDHFRQVVQELGNYWLDVVTLPNCHSY